MQTEENPMPCSYTSIYADASTPIIAGASIPTITGDVETGTNNAPAPAPASPPAPVQAISADILATEINNIKMNIDDIETKLKRTIFSYAGEIASNILLLILAIKVFGNL